MKGEPQPEFEEVDKRGKWVLQQEMLANFDREERQRLAKTTREQRIKGEVAPFYLTVNNTFIPLAFNMITGQVAVRFDGIKGGGEHYDLQTYPHQYRRIKAADGLSLLNMHPHEYSPLEEDEDVNSVYPSWFFARSTEPREELDRVVRRVRRKVFVGRVVNRLRRGVEALWNLGMGVVGFVLYIALIALFIAAGVYVFSGIAGLLEFGHKQL